VYNSVLGKWLNPRAFVNPVNALVTFNGKTPGYYRHIKTFDPNTPVTAAISNFPLLLQSGAVVDTEAEQTDVQKQRGAKGSIGTDGTYIYLAIVSSATVTESAYVLQALGVRDAMNLDGGGTSALWIGGQYTVGPGRLLPNAVLLMKP
ncbi:MAG TPA: phosphodiester glycosidase family protein, partial [Candidatus Limnocylindria bacterium]